MSRSAMDWHRIVLGTEPTREQARLYTQWPDFRGIADRTQDPLIAEAVVILALKSGSVNAQVLILAPHSMESWLLQQIESVALRCFEGCKGGPRAKELIYGYTKLFARVRMNGRVLQMPDEPTHWVSFGFSAEDTLPPWMHGRLLTIE